LCKSTSWPQTGLADINREPGSPLTYFPNEAGVISDLASLNSPAKVGCLSRPLWREGKLLRSCSDLFSQLSNPQPNEVSSPKVIRIPTSKHEILRGWVREKRGMVTLVS